MLEVRLTEAGPRSARAEIVRILEPSPYRIVPECPVYARCGGCDFQHITYEEELWAKISRLNDALRRIAKVPVQASEILSDGQIFGYRNKAVFHSDGTKRGFYAARSKDIVPIGRCLLLKDDINDALKDLPDGREITLRCGKNGLAPPPEEELDGIVFAISGFFQVNTGAALLLYKKAREYAAMRDSEMLIDLYCGVGSLTLFIGRDAGRALGVEINTDAVKAARGNARRNGYSHIEFIASDAEKWETETVQADCVVVDPPRRGLSRGAVRKILGLSPKRIVYVSCDPATLARDLRALEGYAVKEVCAVDMFPRTANVECCCLLAHG